MFVILAFILICALGYYLSRRIFCGLISFFPALRFWYVLTGVGVLILLILLSFMRGILPFSATVKHIIGVPGNYCMGITVYLVFFSLLTDLVFLIPRLMHLPFTAHRFFDGFVTLGVLLATLLTCTYGFIHARQISHVSYDVYLEGRQDVSDLNIVLISDLHLGAVGSERQLDTIVHEINSLDPDVVCIAGDIFDTDFTSIRDPDAAATTLRKLETTYGVYATLGNHDGGKTYSQMIGFLEDADIYPLLDEYTVIAERLAVVGRIDADPIGGYGEESRRKFSDIFKRAHPGMPVIVLDHNPSHVHEYGDNADLILSGHTHRGQIFPFGIVTNLLFDTHYGYAPADEKDPHLIVSSGVGTWGMPMRIGSDCEIVSVKLLCAR